jgi:hypothetical protein
MQLAFTSESNVPSTDFGHNANVHCFAAKSLLTESAVHNAIQLSRDAEDIDGTTCIPITEYYLEERETDLYLKLPDPGGGKQRPGELPYASQ